MRAEEAWGHGRPQWALLHECRSKSAPLRWASTAFRIRCTVVRSKLPFIKRVRLCCPLDSRHQERDVVHKGVEWGYALMSRWEVMEKGNGG